MFKNYITIAWRNLWKHKVFSFINILGLSIGIAFTLLIGAYVWGELQVNHDLNNADNQYIILSKWKDQNLGGEIQNIAELPKALADNYPGLVKNHYHTDLATTDVTKGDKHFRESIQVGDSTLLQMYGFKLLYGDSKTALHDPFSVVITEEMAMKYFNKTDAIGQTLTFESMKGEQHEFTVSGILEPIPLNSVTDISGGNRRKGTEIASNFFFNADASKYFKRNISGWDNVGTVDYVELQNGARPEAVNKAMLDLLHKYETDDVIRISLTPYLVSLKDYNLSAHGGIIQKMVWTLSCIALFILL